MSSFNKRQKVLKRTHKERGQVSVETKDLNYSPVHVARSLIDLNDL